MLERPVLSMVLKQTSVSVCLRLQFIQICDPSLRDTTQQSLIAPITPPCSVRQSLFLSLTHTHTQTYSLVLVRGGATSTQGYFLLPCFSVSTEVRVTWPELKQLIHVIHSKEGKMTFLSVFFTKPLQVITLYLQKINLTCGTATWDRF